MEALARWERVVENELKGHLIGLIRTTKVVPTPSMPRS
jgi:hypothetical protein